MFPLSIFPYTHVDTAEGRLLNMGVWKQEAFKSRHSNPHAKSKMPNFILGFKRLDLNIFKEATPHSAGPGQGVLVGKVLFGAMLGCFGVQVGGLGAPSWRFGWLFGVYVGSCRAQTGVWEVQRQQKRSLERLGLARGRLGIRIWVQHGSNLRQVGGNLGPPWVQLEPTWSQLGSM